MDAEQQLNEMVKAACGEHTCIDDALTALLEVLDADRGLRRKLLTALIATALRRHIYIARQNVRAHLKHTTRDAAGIAAAAEALESFADTWILDDGRRLGDVAREDLELLAGQEWALSQGHEKNARFYSELARRVGRRTVRMALSDEQVQDIWRQSADEDEGAAAEAT